MARSAPPPVIPPDPNRPTLPVSPTEPSPTLDPAAVPVNERYQLPPHQSKVERIGDHMAALSADLRDWTELRIALVQRKVEGVVGIMERLQHLSEAAKLAVPGIVLLLLGALFLLVTIALGLGAWLGHPGWGFLIVTLTLILVGGVFVWLGSRRYKRAQAIVAQAKRERQDSDTLSREQIQQDQADHIRRSAA